MYNEAQAALLDDEFRQILFMIKPLINNIDDRRHLEQYRLWLERLSSIHPTEKLERNKYLLLLAKQIHDNVLNPPFTSIPPKGLLPALGKIQESPSQKPAHSDAPEQEYPEQVQWPHMSMRRPQDNVPVVQKAKMVPLFQKIGQIVVGEEDKSETSSWCDLSEPVTPCETDVEENKSNLRLQQVKEVLKAQEVLNNNQKRVESAKEAELSRRPTQEELEALKLRMKDLLDVKNALRDSQCLTESRKKNMEALQGKLVHAEKQNVDLKAKLIRAEQQVEEHRMLLDSQEQKFMEIDHAKSKELANYKEKFTILRRKEIEFVQEHHKGELADLQQKHSSKVSELEEKISCLKKGYEGKIKEIEESNMSLIKEKEDQIQQLQSELKVRSSQIENDGKGEQLHTLKRCVSKLDKALHKNEKDYVKKIERLKQDLEVREMTSQMQLQTQRANLLLHNSSTKQDELKCALNSLEGKYKKMLETVQSHALEVKKQDDSLIDSLKSLLHKNEISYLGLSGVRT